jgi:hypothetical protein
MMMNAPVVDQNSDSDSEQNYSDNEGIMFTGGIRKRADGNKQMQANPSLKKRKKASAGKGLVQDILTGASEIVKLKRRRRTAENTNVPLFHINEEEIDLVVPAAKHKSRIWTEDLVRKLMRYKY